MATFIDVTGLQAFSKVFVFLISIIGAYVVLSKTKWFSGMKWLAAIASLLAGLLVLMSDLVTGIIQHITPWLAVLFFFFLFIMTASKVVGAGFEVGQFKGILFVVIIAIAIIGTLTYIRANINAPGDLDADGNEIVDQEYETTASFIFHPKFMGIVFILLVAIFTVALMTGKVM